jgi:hypothetical protein
MVIINDPLEEACDILYGDGTPYIQFYEEFIVIY